MHPSHRHRHHHPPRSAHSSGFEVIHGLVDRIMGCVQVE